MASSRLRNSGLKTFSIACFDRCCAAFCRLSTARADAPASAETDAGVAQLTRAGVRRHDQHDLAEVSLAAVVVRQRGVVHDLQQDVEDVRMRLLDLIEQQHGIGMLTDRIDEQAALFEADVPGRRADQTRDGVLLHVLAHVVAHELVAEMHGELLGELGLSDAGRTREEETARGPIRLAKSGARSFDRAARPIRTASSWPKTTRPSDSSRPLRRSLSEEDACFAGIRAMRATTSSMWSGRDLDDAGLSLCVPSPRVRCPSSGASSRPLRR